MSKCSNLINLAKQVHPLADENKPFVKIKFIHSDKKEHFFYSCVNTLSGDRLTAWDNSPPTINDSMADVKRTIQKIRSNAVSITESISSFFSLANVHA